MSSYNQVAGIRHWRYVLWLVCPPSAKHVIHTIWCKGWGWRAVGVLRLNCESITTLANNISYCILYAKWVDLNVYQCSSIQSFMLQMSLWEEYYDNIILSCASIAPFPVCNMQNMWIYGQWFISDCKHNTHNYNNNIHINKHINTDWGYAERLT